MSLSNSNFFLKNLDVLQNILTLIWMTYCFTADAQQVPHPSPTPKTFSFEHSISPNHSLTLGKYYEIANLRCQALMAPVVIIKKRPHLGRLILIKRQVILESVAGCHSLNVPTTEVIYQANSNKGHDNFSWEVRFQTAHRGTQIVNARFLIGN